MKWSVGSKVSGQAAIKASTEGDEDLVLAYADYAFAEGFTLRAGQSYGPLGYLAAEPTGLYTINASPVGLGGTFYGPAARGVELQYGKDAIAATFAIYDGSNSSGDAASDLAFAADLVYTFEKGFVNVEGWYDADAAPGTNGEESVIGLGVNGEYKITDPLKVGAELYYKIADEDSSIGFLGMANYALATAVPMSVTGMVQYVQNDFDAATLDPNGAADTTPSNLSLQAALLTNPTGSSNFGVNGEVGVKMFDADSGNSDDDVTSYWLAGEFLLSF
jgi:hypothetical protein